MQPIVAAQINCIWTALKILVLILRSIVPELPLVQESVALIMQQLLYI